ncbi:energy transducer TonB [Paludibacterium yongneupense]|uniref:energy transducer TonB n=1 Tax=Paludibacterium yongneupense TaxID=400061 RepID=UPI0006846E17|nr:energy transducer TonB [Paludibacterium yongneupense]
MRRQVGPLAVALLLSCAAHALVLFHVAGLRRAHPEAPPALSVELAAALPRAARQDAPAAAPAVHRPGDRRRVDNPVHKPVDKAAAAVSGHPVIAAPAAVQATAAVSSPPPAARGVSAGGAVPGAGGSDCPLLKARYTQAWKPRYPEISRQRGEQGVVGLNLHIAAGGEVLEAIVVQSSGFPRLDAAALAELQGRRLSPALRCGKPVESMLLQLIPFRLDEG